MCIRDRFSPYRLQRLTGIAHDPESELDRAFAERASLRGSLGLIVRSLLALLLGGGDRPTPPSLDFFGVPIVNTTMDEALDWIVARAAALPLTGAADPWEKPRNGSLLAFVNPDCLNIAYRNERYRAVLQSAARVLPDGIGLKIGCRMLGVGSVSYTHLDVYKRQESDRALLDRTDPLAANFFDLRRREYGPEPAPLAKRWRGPSPAARGCLDLRAGPDGGRSKRCLLYTSRCV